MRTLIVLLLTAAAIGAAPPGLQISPNQRFLVSADGKPFFYLGDTAWELFHRLNREDATLYLEDRAKKGFTVIQAVALAELDGLNDPNPYGHRPLLDNDPTKPDVKEGPANDYGITSISSSRKRTRWDCTSDFCPRGATSGTTGNGPLQRSSRPKMPGFTANGLAGAIGTRL